MRNNPAVLRRYVPILEWLPRYRRADLGPDLIAGLTVGAVLVPQSVAYATVAGLPPVVGLYASTVPLLAYSIFGRSRRLGVGPLVTISIIAAAGLRDIAPTGTDRYIAYAATLAVLVGVIHLAFGVARLGWLVRFLSEPVVVGFLAGVGVIIIVSQLGPLTGIAVPTKPHTFQTLWEWVTRLDEIEGLAAVIGIGALAVMLVGRRWPRVPVTLAVLLGSALFGALFDVEEHGVAVVGKLPHGLPLPEVPLFGRTEVVALLTTALAITLVGFTESIALVKRYADQDGTRADPDQELIALGISNVTAGFFQGMVVTGALTRTGVADQAGARTQVTQLVSAGVVVVTLLAFAGVFTQVPQPVLAAIVVLAVVGFFKLAEVRRLWTVKRVDALLLIGTLIATVMLGLELGVLTAVVASIAVVVYRVSRPHIATLGIDEHTGFPRDLAHDPDARPTDGVLMLRVDAPLFFANAEYLRDHLADREAEAAARAPLRIVILDASGIDDLDATGDHELRKIAGGYRERGVTLLLTFVKDEVREVMDRSGFTDLVGADAFYPTDLTALDAARERLSSP